MLNIASEVKNEAIVASLNITDSSEEEESVASSTEPKVESAPPTSKCPAGYILNQTTLLCDGIKDIFLIYLNFDTPIINYKIWTSASSTAKFAVKISHAKIPLAPTSALACLMLPATLASCSALRQTIAKVMLRGWKLGLHLN